MTDQKDNAKLYLAVFIIIIAAAVVIFIINIYPKPEEEITFEDEEDDMIDTVSFEEIKSRMENDDDNFLIIDVRDALSFNEKHIAGSINIPLGELGQRKNEIPYDQDVYITCGADNCGLSRQGAEILIAYGFLNVMEFRNGVQKWQEAGLPLVGGMAVSFSYISTAQVHDKIEIGEDIMIIDVRNKNEYDTSHIAGAVHYEFEELSRIAEDELPKTKKVIIYDKTGDRSMLVTEQLVRQGYTEVESMIGGTLKWEDDGYELVKE